MKYTVTIPDLELKEAVDLIEKSGGGQVIFTDQDGRSVGDTTNRALRPFTSISAWPRTNEAIIARQ